MNFQDAIIEYRYFDHNGDPVDTRDAASIMIGRTDDMNFGSYWYAIDPDGHWQIGRSKTIEGAIRLGSTRVISDRARRADIKIERGDPVHLDRRYKQRVIVNGRHVATFAPSIYGREYYLVDVTGEQIATCGGGYHRIIRAEVDRKHDMIDVVRRWFELIPTEDDIEARNVARAEEHRRAVIRDHAEDMFDAIVEARAEITRLNETGFNPAITSMFDAVINTIDKESER